MAGYLAGSGVDKFQRVLAAETADPQCLWYPLFRDGGECCVERPVESGFHDDRSEAHHGVVTRNRSVGFDVHHYETQGSTFTHPSGAASVSQV